MAATGVKGKLSFAAAVSYVGYAFPHTVQELSVVQLADLRGVGDIWTVQAIETFGVHVIPGVATARSPQQRKVVAAFPAREFNPAVLATTLSARVVSTPTSM